MLCSMCLQNVIEICRQFGSSMIMILKQRNMYMIAFRFTLSYSGLWDAKRSTIRADSPLMCVSGSFTPCTRGSCISETAY